MKREKGDQRAEADEQKQKYRIGSRSGENTRSSHCLQPWNIKGALLIWNQQIETDQSDQKDNAADGKVNRDLPGSSLAVTGAPNSNHQERRNQCKFVKCVEKEEIERRECPGGSGGDKHNTSHITVRVVLDRWRHPRGGERHQRRKQQHCCVQAVDADDKFKIPRGD